MSSSPLPPPMPPEPQPHRETDVIRRKRRLFIRAILPKHFLTFKLKGDSHISIDKFEMTAIIPVMPDLRGSGRWECNEQIQTITWSMSVPLPHVTQAEVESAIRSRKAKPLCFEAVEVLHRIAFAIITSCGRTMFSRLL